MKISFANQRVEKAFLDYNKMKQVLQPTWVRAIKKHMDHFKAAETFSDILALGLGQPEQLKGYKHVRYSIRITSNVRLIVELKTTPEMVMNCSELEIEGVCDYHGGKENWFIP